MNEIKCHGDVTQNGVFKFKPTHWRGAEPVHKDGYQGYIYRSCSYCGCIHPEDLLKAIADGAILEGADWKYGWPHKFYIRNVPNPIAGQQIKVGASDGKPIMGQASKTAGMKWYNVHLEDLDDVEFSKLATAIFEKTKIEFKRDEKGIKYKAPFAGYQAGFHKSVE